MPSLCSHIVIGGVGTLSKALLKAFTDLKVHNLETLVKCVEGRPPLTPLITVSNHASTVDDPLLFGILPLRILWRAGLCRWSLGAEELTHTNFADKAFFGCGRVLPIRRGAGIHQPIMNAAIELLHQGEWIHIFPEGKVFQRPDGQLGRERLKWGVGRLIEESRRPPLLLPIMHHGFHRVLPLDSRVRLFQPVRVNVGDPIDTGILLQQLTTENINCVDERRSRLTELVRLHMIKYL